MRHAGMVVMVVGANQRLEGQAFKLGRLGDALPRLKRQFVVQAGIDQHPAIAIVQQIDIDVVERNGQTDAGPEHALGDAHQLGAAGCRWLKRIAQRGTGTLTRWCLVQSRKRYSGERSRGRRSGVRVLHQNRAALRADGRVKCKGCCASTNAGC